MYRKIFNIFIFIFLLFVLVSCTVTGPKGNNNGNEEGPAVEPFSFREVIKGNELIKLTILKEKSTTFKIEYKESNSNKYIELDNNLITYYDDTVECEILGLAQGSYDVKITDDLNQQMELNDLIVSSIDRSGYAHFNSNEGIGAYNNDGTLKDNTLILYLTNENKNTITATFNGTIYQGIADILANVSKSTVPVLIRVKGKITTNQWNYKLVEPRLTNNSNLKSDHFENTFSTEYGENIANLPLKLSDKKEGISYNYQTTKTGIEKLKNGTTSKSTTTYSKTVFPNITGKTVYDDDCSFNCLQVKNAKNVTIEGLGTDAEFFQWGLSFSDSNSIEVRNMTFSDYQEDACAFYASGEASEHSRFWVYNCTFNKGKNNWDLTGEQDKPSGDGAIDVNSVSNVTVAYNVFNETHKTGLVGSSDTATAKDITFHHNYYYKVQSRIPLARNANIHIYNNYYDDCNTCLSIRSGAFVFSEENYFYSCSSAHVVSGGSIKSFNDVFEATSKIQSTKVSSRTEKVNNNCIQLGKDYSSFDTDVDYFYYDTVNKKSAVSLMVAASNVKKIVNYYSGVSNKYHQLPLTSDEEKNNLILNVALGNNEVDSPDSKDDGLIYDISNLEAGAKTEAGAISAGDFIIHPGFDIALHGSVKIIKNLGSNFKTKEGLIEFTNYVNEKVSIDFCSRNNSATDRYIIIYDEVGNILYQSNPANGSTRMIFTFEVEPNTKYYIGSNSGLTFYNIY